MPLSWSLFILLNALILDCYAFDPLPRWGQAAVVVDDILYVYGGKTDQFNAFGYTTAPDTNDMLYLPLDTVFSAAAPPWVVVSGSSNSSTAQGPSLAWHTASAYSSAQLLIFGGLPDANSNIVLVGQSDSASIVDVWNQLDPKWMVQPSAWASQPSRRIRHSTATILSGLVFVFGGERADGSGTAYSDHYVFNSTSPSFTLLPTNGGPPDIVGQASIPLPDGRILVFGGYIPSQRVFLLLSTIYVLDTTSTPYTWSLLQVSSGSLPNPRRAFAAVLISSSSILIHGGGDAALQTSLNDGWVLDLSQPIAVWSRLDSLTAVGARRDHFAISAGNQVVFGFGYSQSAAATDPIQVYDVQGATIVPSFTPPAPTITATPTLPPVPQDSAHSTHTASGGNTPVVTEHPNPSPDLKQDKTTAIAVGTTFGFLAVAAILVASAYYRRKKQKKWEQRRFWVIDGDDVHAADDDSQLHRDIPLAGHNSPDASEAGQRALPRALLSSVGFATLLRGPATRPPQNPWEVRERRNMLDDEDGADFGTWYNSKRRDGTGGSSWSLMSILGRKTREPSQHGHSSSSSRREKSDPFSDGASLMQDEETGFIGASSHPRPNGRRELSHVSTRSDLSYSDPFSDPIQENPMEPSDTAYQEHVRLVPPLSSLSHIRTSIPLEFTGHALSPLSEKTSQSTLRTQDNGSSNENVVTPFSSTNSRNTANTSLHDPPLSPTLLSGLLPTPDHSLKRSGSWWSRLARRASDASSRSTQVHMYRDIRDPNPPPRLEVIDEKLIPEGESFPSKQSSRAGSARRSAAMNDQHHPYVARHDKSMSSVRTVDSEAIEKIAGTMEVVQILHSEGENMGSVYSISVDEGGADEHGSGELVFGEVKVFPGDMINDYRRDGDGGDASSLRAPVSDRALSAEGGSSILSMSTQSILSSKSAPPPSRLTFGTSLSADGLRSAPLPPGGGRGLTARAQTVGRRLTVDGPRGPRSAEERGGGRTSVDYGLVPRRSLFIVNPDQRLSGTEE